jgi:hypothetical protein
MVLKIMNFFSLLLMIIKQTHLIFLNYYEDNKIEKVLSRLETDFSKIINKIVNSNLILSEYF